MSEQQTPDMMKALAVGLGKMLGEPTPPATPQPETPHGVCECGAPLADAGPIGLYCTLGWKCPLLTMDPPKLSPPPDVERLKMEAQLTLAHEKIAELLERIDTMSEREIVTCGLCGEPMPPGEEMFNYHGYSGPCPKPPALAAEDESDEGAARPEGSGDSWAPPLRRPVPLATPQTETLLDVPHAEVDALVEAIYAERRALSPPDMERLQQRWDTRETALRALVETLKNEAQALRYMVGEQARRGALNACAVAIEEILEPPQ